MYISRGGIVYFYCYCGSIPVSPYWIKMTLSWRHHYIPKIIKIKQKLLLRKWILSVASFYNILKGRGKCMGSPSRSIPKILDQWIRFTKIFQRMTCLNLFQGIISETTWSNHKINFPRFLHEGFYFSFGQSSRHLIWFCPRN